jgi:hypothetical protein
MKVSELVGSQEILQYIQFHEELNPTLWENKHLKQEVRDKLLEIADEFYEFLELPNLEIIDIIFCGSNAAFNYSSLSDIDLHLLVDMSKIDCERLAENFFNTKKTLWNKLHEIEINGFSVELYVEDVKNPVNAAGIYSVKHDRWKKEPTPSKPGIDDTSLVSKTNQYIDAIDSLMASEPAKGEVRALLDDIYALRKAGLETGSEFSIENLTFKSLRNLGYMDKLRGYIIKASDREMSIYN